MTVQSLKDTATSAVQAPVATAKPPQTIAAMMERYKSEIARALPKHLDADRLARIALTEFRKTPALLECDPKSLLGAVIQAAQLGLEPGSALGQCYLLPFKNSKTGTTDVQFIVGYRGMIDLARRSGQIESINAYAVHEGDDFNVSLGLSPDIDHKPNWELDRSNPDTIQFVYAVAVLRGGAKQFEVMTRSQIEAIRKRSKAGHFGPWKTDYEAMALKTVIRRLFKYLPASVEMVNAATLDEAAATDVSQELGGVLDGEVVADAQGSAV